MRSMFVTLDMLKLSVWLNACAFCRVQREAYHKGDMEGQETGGRGGGSLSNVQGRPDWCMGGMGTRGAHLKHVLHARDTGRVETQWLVERRRRLPSQKGGIP